MLLNTCHIREKAAEKVYSELGRIRDLKAERPAAGWRRWSASPAAWRRRRAARSSSAAGRRPGDRAADLSPPARGAPESARNGEKVVETDYAVEDKFEHLPKPRRAEIIGRGVTAFLTVQEGCDKFCTFCVVPYTRGSEVSRPVAQIVAEAEKLAEAGVREVTLLGQNVNAWHGEGPDGTEWGLGPAAVPAGGNSRHRAAALHDQPPARHGRRADRGASRPGRADALSASAGAVGLRPHPQGDEPPAQGGRLSQADRAHPRRAAATSPCRATSSSVSRARPTPISRRRWSWCGPSATRRPFRSNIRRAPARPARR